MNMEKCQCCEILKEVFPFFDDLPELQKDKICKNTQYCKYQKGENIHGNMDICTGAIIVKSGSLRTYMISSEGREITLYRLFNGDFCMLTASCVIKSITFDVFVDAEEDSECYIISSGVLMELNENNIFAENFFLNSAVSKFSEVMWVMQQILFMSFDKRLAVFLYDEICKNGDNVIKLTQDQIARYIGSAREVVSRMLKHFSNDGIVKVTRGSIEILDKVKLREIAVKS